MSKPNREIRVRHFRQPARGHPARHRIARRAGRSRQMSLRTERCAAARAVIGIIASTAPPNVPAGIVGDAKEKLAQAAPANVAAGGQLRRCRRTALARSYRSPTRAPNCRRTVDAVEPDDLRRHARRPRPSPVRSTRRTTSARTQAIPAPTDRWSPRAGSSRRAWLRRRRPRHRRTIPRKPSHAGQLRSSRRRQPRSGSPRQTHLPSSRPARSSSC